MIKKSNFKVLFTLLCVLAFGSTILAQEKTVRGLVADESGEPMIGVTVQIEGTSIFPGLNQKFLFLL
jgi:hypothetical protein